MGRANLIDDSGQTAVEYVLVASLVLAVTIAALLLLTTGMASAVAGLVADVAAAI
jgi:Flp pilus assembly pilin Flp